MRTFLPEGHLQEGHLQEGCRLHKDVLIREYNYIVEIMHVMRINKRNKNLRNKISMFKEGIGKGLNEPILKYNNDYEL